MITGGGDEVVQCALIAKSKTNASNCGRNRHNGHIDRPHNAKEVVALLGHFTCLRSNLLQNVAKPFPVSQAILIGLLS